jgi:hypothetical protein
MNNKIPKWLDSAYSLYPNEEFFIQFHEQIPVLFENLIGRKINWQRACLFIEPIGEKYVLHYSLDAPLLQGQNRELVLLKCRLGSVEGSIGWYNASGLETISIHDKIGDIKLNFCLQDFDLRASLFHTILSVYNRPEKKTLMIVDEASVYYTVLEHEGIVAIEFIETPNHETLKMVGDLLEEGRHGWNTDGTRGYFHNIYFSEMDNDKRALYYYDNGSAQDGQFIYILNKLAGKSLGIKEIEITGL